jgi:hypothetical protein
MPDTKKKSPAKPARKGSSTNYDKFKEHKGRKYTGMKVGRTHTWKYNEGKWMEKKITPDKWDISYEVIKRRAGKAPEGSGVPVGTEYHWFILAHQKVRKLDANNYTTEMKGNKYKIAHKRYDKENWSASEKAQKKKLIKVLQGVITTLESELEEM